MPTYAVHLNVTDKETEIVKLLADGNTIPDIAVKMGLNRRSLEAKVATLKDKYRSSTVAHLVAVFLRNKLID